MAAAGGVAAAALALAAAWGCGGGAGGEPGAEAVDGQRAYAVQCSHCHDVPNGIGAEITAEVLAAYATVGRLDRYLRAAMPHEAPGSLPAAEYEAVLKYLVESRGVVPEGAGAGDLPDSTRLIAGR